MSPIKSIAELLRESTRLAHRALDHHPLLAPLSHCPVTRTTYADALAALHGPQRAIEGMLCGFTPETDFPSRLADLESDLESLGISPFELSVDLPRVDSAEQLIGIMYVIEGSNLGGAVIARLLEESLPAAVPRKFFSNAGGHARWEKFWQFAATRYREGNAQAMTDSACQTFALYKAHLDQYLLTSKNFLSTQ